MADEPERERASALIHASLDDPRLYGENPPWSWFRPAARALSDP